MLERSTSNSPILGGAADLLRTGFGCRRRRDEFCLLRWVFPKVCDHALLGGGGGVGWTLVTDFARSGGGGVGTELLLVV